MCPWGGDLTSDQGDYFSVTYGAGLCIEQSWLYFYLFLLFCSEIYYSTLSFSHLPKWEAGWNGHRSSLVALSKKKARLKFQGSGLLPQLFLAPPKFLESQWVPPDLLASSHVVPWPRSIWAVTHIGEHALS